MKKIGILFLCFIIFFSAKVYALEDFGEINDNDANYANVDDTNGTNNELEDDSEYELKDEDDPRFDMVRVSVGNPRPNWVGNPKLEQREGEGYVFMWIEE